MKYKFCPECGYKFEKEYKFCPECGYKLNGDNENHSDYPAINANDKSGEVDSLFDAQLDDEKNARESYEKQLTKGYVYCKRGLYAQANAVYELLLNKNPRDVNACIGFLRISTENFQKLSSAQADDDLQAIFRVASPRSDYRQDKDFEQFLEKKNLTAKWNDLIGEKARASKKKEEEHRKEVYEKLYGKSVAGCVFSDSSFDMLAKQKEIDDYIAKEETQKRAAAEAKKKKEAEERLKREKEEAKRKLEEEKARIKAEKDAVKAARAAMTEEEKKAEKKEKKRQAYLEKQAIEMSEAIKIAKDLIGFTIDGDSITIGKDLFGNAALWHAYKEDDDYLYFLADDAFTYTTYYRGGNIDYGNPRDVVQQLRISDIMEKPRIMVGSELKLGCGENGLFRAGDWADISDSAKKKIEAKFKVGVEKRMNEINALFSETEKLLLKSCGNGKRCGLLTHEELYRYNERISPYNKCERFWLDCNFVGSANGGYYTDDGDVCGVRPYIILDKQKFINEVFRLRDEQSSVCR